MPEVRYLTADDVLALTAVYFPRLGYVVPILRANGRQLLESAVARPRHAAVYTGADLLVQAAMLTNGIALNHPFLDGNKRSAFAAGVTFLALNDCPVPDHALPLLAEQLTAIHEETDRTRADADLAAWLRRYCTPPPAHGPGLSDA